jgi:uncharacterized DUF497 family protein
MEFECDPEKSNSNKAKHGIDFEQAKQLWEDPDRLEISARTEEEPRYMTIGTIGDAVWSAVFTYRGERVRIISVRRARESEVRAYESE